MVNVISSAYKIRQFMQVTKCSWRKLTDVSGTTGLLNFPIKNIGSMYIGMYLKFVIIK